MTTQGEVLQNYHHSTDLIEMNGFIGLLYYAGIWKVNNVAIKELWSNTEGFSIYRCTMPCSRFIFLSTCLRFDDKSKRPKKNKFASVEKIWKIFIKNCGTNYKPHNFCTVAKSKSRNKLVTLNDVKTFYLINAIPYTSKVTVEKDLFLKVTEPIYGTGRSVTCDNWFTSIPLIEKASKDPYKIKITGTIGKNECEIPLEMKIAGEENTAKFGFHDDIALLSWTQEKNKTVLVASSFVKSIIIEETTDKPAILSHYNETKDSADVFDKLCNSYTVARGTKRWSLKFFFLMLDQAAVNARILYTCHKVNENKIEERLSARQSQKQIAFHLMKPLLRQRLTDTSSLRVGIRRSIESILKINAPPSEENRPFFQKRLRCAMCDRRRDHKTKAQCPSCNRPMCDEHRLYLCTECGGAD